MCGIAGFLTGEKLRCDQREDIALKMGQSMAHRGPDGSGIWTDKTGQIALSHRRLAVLDLSEAGKQPMISNSGQFVISFNGEIYNHLEIRKELSSNVSLLKWRGHSDTETLLQAIDEWGLEETLVRTHGMFAIALWDRKDEKLYLARDRIGEKPLYFGWQKNTFLFASELKAFKQHPDFVGEINRNAISLQLRHGYIPAPHSIYNGVYKLTPGTIAVIKPGDPPDVFEQHKYWSFESVVEEGLNDPLILPQNQIVDELDQLVSQSVGSQMIADTELGAFLSGGIDSSLVVSSMQKQSSKPVKTFTIGFNEASYNEAEHAKSIAKYLGTDHTELYVSADQTLEVVPALSAIFDEPFSDVTQIPNFLISQLARRNVTVALSGDGGDELFGGYSRYLAMSKSWERLRKLPNGVRKITSKSITSVSVSRWDKLTGLTRNSRSGLSGDKIHKGANLIFSENFSEYYFKSLSQYHSPENLVIGALEPKTKISNTSFRLQDLTHQMMAIDTETYLPDDILCKVDRTAMGNSLETRVPLLDQKIIEFAWKIPLNLKIVDGQGKWVLRNVLERYLPKELFDRPKKGFSVPIDLWLRGPLFHWADELLEVNRLRREGYLDPELVQVLWQEHQSGIRNWQYQLWNILMFQSWLELEKNL